MHFPLGGLEFKLSDVSRVFRRGLTGTRMIPLLSHIFREWINPLNQVFGSFSPRFLHACHIPLSTNSYRNIQSPYARELLPNFIPHSRPGSKAVSSHRTPKCHARSAPTRQSFGFSHQKLTRVDFLHFATSFSISEFP